MHDSWSIKTDLRPMATSGLEFCLFSQFHHGTFVPTFKWTLGGRLSAKEGRMSRSDLSSQASKDIQEIKNPEKYYRLGGHVARLNLKQFNTSIFKTELRRQIVFECRRYSHPTCSGMSHLPRTKKHLSPPKTVGVKTRNVWKYVCVSNQNFLLKSYVVQ